MLLRRRRPAHEAVIKLGINPLRRCQLAYGVVGEIWRQALPNLVPNLTQSFTQPDLTQSFVPGFYINTDVNYFQNFHQNFNQFSVSLLATTSEQSWRLVRHLTLLVTAFDARESPFLKPLFTSTTRISLNGYGKLEKNNSLTGGFKKKNSRHCCRLFSYFLISSMIIAIVKINTTVSRILPIILLIIFSPNSKTFSTIIGLFLGISCH